MKKLLLTAIAATALFACSTERDCEIPSSAGHTIELSFVSESISETRAFFDPVASAEEWEKSLNSASIFIFDNYGKLALRRDLSKEELKQKKISFAIPWSVAESPLSFYAVANLQIAESILSESGLRAVLDVEVDRYNSQNGDVFTKSIKSGGFTMSGHKKDVILSKTDNRTKVSLSLKRTVAKVALRVAVDSKFSKHFGGGAVVVTGSRIKRVAKETTVISPESSVSGNLNYELYQKAMVSDAGTLFNNLYYVFECDKRATDNEVVIEVDALFDQDGNFSTTEDQAEMTYTIVVNKAGGSEILRNGYYRIDATLTGLSGVDVEVDLVVTDWEAPVTQIEQLGN